MAEAQITRTETAVDKTCSRLQSLAATAGPLALPVLTISAVSLASAGCIWLVCFASYVLDSFTAALACLTVLALLLAPGSLLLGLYFSLSEIARLPQRLVALGKLDPQALGAGIKPLVLRPEGQELHQRALTQLRALSALRAEVLDDWTELARIARTAALISLVAHPAGAALIVASAVVTVLLAVFAVLAVLLSVLGAIF